MPASRSEVLVRIRRSIAAAVVAVLAILVAPTSAHGATPGSERGFIAHAFGSPPTGETYTNSLAAFYESHRKGFRTFEIDMVRLKDGKVLLAHDRFETRYGLPAGTRFSEVTSAQMKGRKLDGKWPVLLGDDFLHLVKNHPDSTFILDTKADDLEIAAWFVKYMARTSLARIAPHVYSQAHLNGLKTLYPWPGYVIATYRWSKSKIEQKALELVTRNGLRAVMIRPLEVSPTFEARLRQAGARWFWVHSLSDAAVISTWRTRGWGVYSNGWIGETSTAPPTPTPTAVPAPSMDPGAAPTPGI